MKKLGLFLLIWILFTGLASAEVIKIAVSGAFTGQLASFGEGIKNAALLKAEEINASGEMYGKKVVIVLEDDLCDPRVAATVATKLANDPEVSIVMATCAALLPSQLFPSTKARDCRPYLPHPPMST